MISSGLSSIAQTILAGGRTEPGVDPVADVAPLPHPASSFSYISWGKNVGLGFVEEGISSFKALFSLNGLIFGTATAIAGAIPSRLPWAGWIFVIMTKIGLAWGGLNLLTGLYFSIQEGQEEAGKRIGSGFFYLIPFGGFLLRTVRARQVRMLKQAAKKQTEEGAILTEVEDLRKSVEKLKRQLDRDLKGLPGDVASKIRHSVENPEPTNFGNLRVVAAASFPDRILIASHYVEEVPPLLGELFNVYTWALRIHEARHLRQYYESAPRLWWACVNRGGIDHRPTPRETYKLFGGKDLKLLWESIKIWLVKPKQKWEREGQLANYQAVRESLAGINWQKTCAGVIEKSGSEWEFKEAGALADEILECLAYPFRMSAPEFFSCRIVPYIDDYPRMSFFNDRDRFVSEVFFFGGLYSYLVGNDVFRTSVRTAKRVSDKSIDIDIEVHFH